MGSATGGDQGLGTINAQGLYVNGVAVPAASSGTFTGTLTGCTTSPTAGIRVHDIWKNLHTGLAHPLEAELPILLLSL